MSNEDSEKLPDEQIEEDLRQLKEGDYQSERTVKISKSRQHFIRIPSEMADHFDVKKGQEVRLNWSANDKTTARIEFLNNEKA